MYARVRGSAWKHEPHASVTRPTLAPTPAVLPDLPDPVPREVLARVTGLSPEGITMFVMNRRLVPVLCYTRESVLALMRDYSWPPRHYSAKSVAKLEAECTDGEAHDGEPAEVGAEDDDG